jgi:hypothetical protein
METMDKRTALELYAIFRQENSLWLASHREHSQQYFTLVIAILAASVAAISQSDKLSPLIMGLFAIGPIINLFLCKVAIALCDRSYQAYLEGISVQQKLETVVGLTEKRNLSETNSLLVRFVKDEYILPERWLESQQFATAGAFVSHQMKKGANQIIKQTFNILYYLNLFMALGIEAYFLLRVIGAV